MSYNINVRCRKCGIMKKITSSVPETEYLHDLIERKTPYLCIPCWCDNYAREEDTSEEIRKGRCHCKNCFYYEERYITDIRWTICNLNKKAPEDIGKVVINPDNLCGEWCTERFLWPTDNKPVKKLERVESRFELMILE